MPDDRPRRLAIGTVREVGDRRSHGVLVLGWQHRQRQADGLGDRRPPHASAAHHHVGVDRLAGRRAHPTHGAAVGDDLGDRRLADEARAAFGGARRLRLPGPPGPRAAFPPAPARPPARPSPSVAYAPSRPSRSIVGHAAIASSGPIIRPRHPNARAAPHRRHSSASRSSEYATSSVPTGSSAGPPVVARLAYFRTVASAVSVMNRDVLVRLIKPGACDDEPPVANSGPLSTTVTSGSPRSTSSSASAAPTTPAPMITKRRGVIRSALGGLQDRRGDRAGVVQSFAIDEHVGVALQERQEPAARRLDPPHDVRGLERVADLFGVLRRTGAEMNRLDSGRDIPDPPHPATIARSVRATLRLDPLARRVVHRLERYGDGVAVPDDVRLP